MAAYFIQDEGGEPANDVTVSPRGGDPVLLADILAPLREAAEKRDVDALRRMTPRKPRRDG